MPKINIFLYVMLPVKLFAHVIVYISHLHVTIAPPTGVIPSDLFLLITIIII